jgi:outer membrane murein-binding lipoprotein Lpp
MPNARVRTGRVIPGIDDNTPITQERRTSMNELTPIEYQNQRILTTQQLAEVYGTDNKHISENYINNATRYLEGKHFYRLEGEGLRDFKEGYPNISDSLKFTSILYLWTEKGAWLHAKSLGTDAAWSAYEMLVDEYYNIKTQQLPATVEDMIIMQAQSVKELKAKVDRIEVNAEFAKEQAITAHQRIDAMDNTDIIGDLQQRLVRIVNKYSERNGLTYSTGWKNFRQSYNTAFHTNISLRRKHYMESRGIKRMSIPEYLAATEQLPDALRVAEKMLKPAYALN